MDAKLKADWVKALRSGEYRQTMGTLRDRRGFCCLGVLCDISGEGQWTSTNVDEGVQAYQVGGQTSRQYFPIPLKAALGLTDEMLDPLMDKNDTGKSFRVIADDIEQNL